MHGRMMSRNQHKQNAGNRIQQVVHTPKLVSIIPDVIIVAAVVEVEVTHFLRYH